MHFQELSLQTTFLSTSLIHTDSRAREYIIYMWQLYSFVQFGQSAFVRPNTLKSLFCQGSKTCLRYLVYDAMHIFDEDLERVKVQGCVWFCVCSRTWRTALFCIDWRKHCLTSSCQRTGFWFQNCRSMWSTKQDPEIIMGRSSCWALVAAKIPFSWCWRTGVVNHSAKRRFVSKHQTQWWGGLFVRESNVFS